jgi:hypothetical protein
MLIDVDDVFMLFSPDPVLRPRSAIIYAHGNAEDLSSNIRFLFEMAQRSLSYLRFCSHDSC